MKLNLVKKNGIKVNLTKAELKKRWVIIVVVFQ